MEGKDQNIFFFKLNLTNNVYRYWAMHFDANPLIVQELGKKLSVDTRVLRHTFIKLGDKLETVVARPDKT
jgi:small subunit ribosomal protein S6